VDLPEDLQFREGMSLEEALSRFVVTLAVLQEPAAVRRVADEICEDAAAEGVTTLEIRFAPQLHGGAPMEEIVDAALEGAAGRAGILLCGLYGEPPELLDRLVDIAAGRKGVVGLDLAGEPRSDHPWSMSDYAPAFQRASDLGIGRTVHAGEGRPPEEIRTAILELDAQRIGHGTSLLQNPEVLELVVERGIVIEACPTSNVHTGAIEAAERHPLPLWLNAGARACINTDNTLFSAVDAPTEHSRAAALPGMDAALLEKCVDTGHQAAFHRD
jgi:adenosine deaminase